jgi:hypothetical protein
MQNINHFESSGDAIKMQVKKVVPLKKAANELTESIKLTVCKDKVAAEKLLDLKEILKSNEGSIPVFMYLSENGSNRGKLFSLTNIRVKISNNLIKSLTDLLGEESIILKSK